MDKRSKKKKKQKKRYEGRSRLKLEEDYDLLTYEIESKPFDYYYKLQLNSLLGDEEFELFKTTLKTPLNVSFRVNPIESEYKTLIDIFSNPDFIENMVSKQTEEEKDPIITKISNKKRIKLLSASTEEVMNTVQDVRVKKWEFYPGELVYELSINRMELKKSVILAGVHSFLQECVEGGLINRQEVVSMIPPLLLEIQPQHSVLDMCAAPGSKTCQVLEFLGNSNVDVERGEEIKGIEEMKVIKGIKERGNSGFVIANEIEESRAYMLTHQLMRLNEGNVLIVSHAGQSLPDLETPAQSAFLFDRIICDVPCSGDAAIRKIPSKWKRWSPYDGISLHSIQLKLARRAFQLLKPGGIMSYSTCSLNPIENEAVIAALLSNLHQAHIIHPTHLLKDFRTREGLTKWRVLVRSNSEGICEEESRWREYSRIEDVTEVDKSQIQESMFPPQEDSKVDLKKCIRILPHDNDTSGFFICLIKKETKVVGEYKEYGDVGGSPNCKSSLLGIGEYIQCSEKDPELELISQIFELSPSFPISQLYSQKGSLNKLHYVSAGAQDYISAVSEHIKNGGAKLNLINMGLRCFARNKSRFGGLDCPFRIAQEGAKMIAPSMGNARKVFLSPPHLLQFFNHAQQFEISTIHPENLRDRISSLSIGCFLFIIEGSSINHFPVVAHKHFKHIRLLLNSTELNIIKRKLVQAIQ